LAKTRIKAASLLFHVFSRLGAVRRTPPGCAKKSVFRLKMSKWSDENSDFVKRDLSALSVKVLA
jgi:hypothetical protein